MSSFRRSVRGLSALLASLSLLGSGSASFAAGGKNAKVGHDGRPRGFDVEKGANQGEGKDKDGNRKGRKDKVNDLSATPAARGSSKPSSVFGEISGFAKKTGASFWEMSTLAKVAGVLGIAGGIGELVSIMSTSRGLIERLAIWLEAMVRRHLALDENLPEFVYDSKLSEALIKDPHYAAGRPLIGLFMWGKNVFLVDRCLAFSAGKQNKEADEYRAYAFDGGDTFKKQLFKWKPTFFNRLLYKLGQHYGKWLAEKESKKKTENVNKKDPNSKTKKGSENKFNGGGMTHTYMYSGETSGETGSLYTLNPNDYTI